MKKINPNLEKLAKLTYSQELIDRERKLAEELRKAEEANQRRVKEETIQKRQAYLESQRLDEERKGKLEKYINALNLYEGTELDTSFFAFVNNPNFPKIYNQIQTIPTVTDRWGFIMRRAYEIGQEVEILIGYNFQTYSAPIKKKFEEYGIHLLCPYFKENKDQLMGQECHIDGEPISSSCNGQHEQCVVFDDRAKKAAAGLIQLFVITRNQPKIQIPKIEVETVDTDDLDDWWKMEGKYE